MVELSYLDGIGRERIADKFHMRYFKDYFTYLSAKTVVIERHYVDRDFLEDYSAYYVRCYRRYDRHCARIHFFSLSFDEEEFKNHISNTSAADRYDDLCKSYLGFVVVRPLPRTIFGRTCLKTYSDMDSRKFPITRKYRPNLYGIPLEVETLAFQEQDGVLSACATAAVWSALQGTGITFQHHIPSPSEVTVAANEGFPIQSRYLPSEGLSIEQMACAIRKFELEPYLIKVEHNISILQATAYAYLRGGIPVILAVSVYDATDPRNAIYKDGHAVTLTGYHVMEGDATPFPDSDLYLKALRSDKVYAHDDQVGPFSRLEYTNLTILDREYVNAEKTPIPLKVVKTSMPDNLGNLGNIMFAPIAAMIPLYHKIRIPFKSILLRVALINDTLVHSKIFNKGLVEWDIFLSDVNALKKELREAHVGLPRNRLISALTKGYPKYIWRATCEIDKTRLLEIHFDATDIEQGDFFFDGILYECENSDCLLSALDIPELQTFLKEEVDAPFWEWLRQQAVQ